jgi:hypothetical protein
MLCLFIISTYEREYEQDLTLATFAAISGAIISF